MEIDDRAIYATGRESLAEFSILTSKDYQVNWHHLEIIKKLEAVERGEIKRLMIFMPPRHGKSELATIKFPAWFMGRNPNKSVISTSYTQELASTFGRSVRNICQSPEYTTIFPNVELSDDSQAANRFHVSGGGQYIAVGMGGSLTGRGGHVIIIDDPIRGREDADSETIRRKVIEWYSSVLYTRQEQDAAIVLILTRWHEDDLAGHLLAQMEQGGDKWDILNLPALATCDEPHRKESEALWPEKYPTLKLEEFKRNMNPRDWQSLYQQNPIAAESQEFHAEWFRYYDDLPDDLTIVTVVDPAFKKRPTSDYSVVLTAAKSKNKTYLLEYVRKRMNPAELIDSIVLQVKKWQPYRLGVEAYAAQAVIGFYLNERLQEEGIGITAMEITQKGDKLTKIRRLVAPWRDGKIFHKKHMTELETELLSFPVGKHDDIIDAVQMVDEFKIYLGEDPLLADSNYFEELGIEYNKFGEPVYH